ncbi:hypothetical protein TSAR_001123 [Trichomalopsis sarcophagae]|uniref:Transmembrane protein n=1 Tax=Trichomalopsis sarcophagae TaxID=543379 RepID=A0A232EVK0_9HYME|nr:hypothetical protein TSAR_001123 [Trichomalopsis sarcophagae]
MNNTISSPPPTYLVFGEIPAMTIEESRRSQRPYRYGMVLLCVGALINWLGLAENYVEPVRYVGVACIVAGALLICAAMCCWLHAPPTRTNTQTQRTTHPLTAQIDDPIHVISIEEPSTGARQKPPDYEAVADAPPSYDDAIKLNPGQLARSTHRSSIGATSAISIEHTIPGTVVGVVVPANAAVAVIAEPPTLTPPPPYAR